MTGWKSVFLITFFVIFCNFCSFAEDLEQNWQEFLHYVTIGRLDVAEGFAEQILESEPDPVKLLELSQQNPRAYDILLRVYAHSEQLKDSAGKILDIIEKGRYVRRTDAEIIGQEIQRLSGTTRGRMEATERLRNAGEYAVPFMIDAMLSSERESEFAVIAETLGKMGRGAVRPLVAALQVEKVGIKAEIIRALGKLGYSQALPYLKYVMEQNATEEIRQQAGYAISQIDPAASEYPAAELFYSLADSYYYHKDSLSPSGEYDFANIWFWDEDARRLVREEVDKGYFHELMAMRCCEWALRADAELGKAVGLWIAAFFKAESTGLEQPEYFGNGHADAMTYARTLGPEYLHQALMRAVNDKNRFVALGAVEALAVNAGEKSLMYWIGDKQPLIEALAFDDRSVRYSAAIAIAQAGPSKGFPESSLIIENLAGAVSQQPSDDFSVELTDAYAMRALNAMLKLAIAGNEVIDLRAAEKTLIDASEDSREDVQIYAGRILARLYSPDAQRAVAETALNEQNSMTVRTEAFTSLAVSAKKYGNMLTEMLIDDIYGITADMGADAELRTAAAGAYGSLNLPSSKVKTLILDQAKK